MNEWHRRDRTGLYRFPGKDGEPIVPDPVLPGPGGAGEGAVCGIYEAYERRERH